MRFSSCQASNADPLCRQISEYVLGRLSLPGRFEQLASWRARQAELQSGDIQVCWICGLTYVAMASASPPPVELLAAPVMAAPRYQQRAVYFSDVIVRSDAAWRTFAELRGRRWAFNEPGSHSGYNILRYQLARMGETAAFFGKVIMAGSHQRSLRMLLRQEIDGCAIDSTVLETELASDPQLADQIRVIDTWGPSPIPPWVVHTNLPASLRSGLRHTFLTMHQDSAGRSILAKGDIARFAPVVDTDYDRIREMASLAGRIDLRPTQ